MTFEERVAKRGWRVIDAPAPRELKPSPEERPIGARARWLNEVLTDADRSGRLTAWERDFVNGMRRRFERGGAAMAISQVQFDTLCRIEEKIYAAG